MEQQMYIVRYVDESEEKPLESIKFEEIILKCRCHIAELPPNPEVLPFKDVSTSTLYAWLTSEFKIIDIWIRSIPLLDRIQKPDFQSLLECTFPSIALLRMAFLSRKLENRINFIPCFKLTSQTAKRFFMNPKLYDGLRKLADEMQTLNCTDVTFIALLLFTQPDVEGLVRKEDIEQIHDFALASFLYWRHASSEEYWVKICKIIAMARKQEFMLHFLFWISRPFVNGVYPYVTVCKKLIATLANPALM